jgi:hypothetical protein
MQWRVEFVVLAIDIRAVIQQQSNALQVTSLQGFVQGTDSAIVTFDVRMN